MAVGLTDLVPETATAPMPWLMETLVAFVLEGHEAVRAARQVIGATNPIEAAPGSIRGDYGLEVQTNLVHGSDSSESSVREISLFFPEMQG